MKRYETSIERALRENREKKRRQTEGRQARNDAVVARMRAGEMPPRRAS